MKKDIYTNCLLLSVGCKVFLDDGGEITAPAGKYSDGLVCYTVNAFGTITELNQCGGTTTTTTTTTTTAAPTTTTTTAAPTTTTTTTTAAPTTTTTTTTAAPSATLAWTFSEIGGAVATMDLYVNGSVVESRTSTSSGTYTVYVGDTINVELNQNQCTGGDTYANVFTSGILVDADCVNNGIASLTTANYTVLIGDIGNTLSLDTFASCDGGCL